jgi:DNA-binding CsgD family transcriptional regulator
MNSESGKGIVADSAPSGPPIPIEVGHLFRSTKETLANKEVLRLSALGHSDRVIAQSLNVGRSTVRRYRRQAEEVPQTAGQETASFTHLMGIHACCGILKIAQQARLSPRHENMDKTARFV